ncbi:MAG: hypothetical protein KDA65_18370 [Planctomycetaceae bacterium]|nr:hypothetical protein [Planctomycetaceae bacterium]
MKTNKLNPKGPLLWFVSIGVGLAIFITMTFLGYNANSGNVVQAGSLEINPEYIKILLSLSALLIPWINSRWPGIGDLLAKLLNLFVDPKEEPIEETNPKTDIDHFCDLHEIGLQFATRQDSEGIKLCTQLFERMLTQQMQPLEESKT